MPLDLEGVVLRVMRLEKWLRKVGAILDDLRDQIGAIRLRESEDQNSGREGEIVIVRPAETIGPASFTEAVTGPPYQEARIVPDTGLARIWYGYDPDTGELRARDTTRRWQPPIDPDPEGEFIAEDARVTIDNINPSESIPSTARYVVCAKMGGRWRALVWECPPS
jgi:hypothetical protein